MNVNRSFSKLLQCNSREFGLEMIGVVLRVGKHEK